MRTPILLSLFCLALLQTALAQYEYSFEFSEPMPVLESSLEEYYPEEQYYVFHFDADSLYQDLINTGDSVTVSWDFGGEYVFDIVLNNYSVTDPRVENPSGSFTKKGKVIDNDTSIVYAHFSPDYFWIEITIGLKNLSIYPVRTINGSLSSYSDFYIIEEYTTSYNPPNQSNTCEDLYIEIYVITDQPFFEKFKNDPISDIIDAHIMRFEKFLNQTLRPQSDDGEIFVQAVVKDINAPINLYVPANDPFDFILTTVRDRCAERNYDNNRCLFPDLYLGLTGLTPGYNGKALRATACVPTPPFEEYEEYPGLALAVFGGLGNGFEFTEDLANGASTKIAHEMCHVLGANDLSVSSGCGFDCSSQTDCALMCTEGCNRFVLDNCSKTTITGHFDNNCNECYSSFTAPNACIHCEVSGKLVTYRDFPMIANCESENEFSVFYFYQNDCDQANVDFVLGYQTDQVQVLDKGAFIEDVYQGPTSRVLRSQNVSLDPQEQKLYYATFKLINDPLNYAPVNNVQLDFLVYEGGFPVFQIHNSDLDLVTYVIPKEIIGTKNLSQLLEPQSGYIFDSDNTSGCSVINDAFIVNGILNIDNDYCFYNTSILLEDESSIVIKDGYSLNLNNCKVSGCAELSNGFVIEDGGSLEVNGSQIEDALIAIDMESGSSLTTKNSKFLNNRYGIRAILLSGEVDLNVLEGNEFSSNRGLKSPFEGRQSYAGISLYGVNNCNITGIADVSGNGLNKFSNSTYGIYLVGSDAIINNFIMDNIRIDPNFQYEHGRGIYITGQGSSSTTVIGSTNIMNNIFTNCETGIEAYGSNLEIKYCNILNTDVGILPGFSRTGNVSIHHNEFSTKLRGIYLNHSFGLNADINNNVFVTNLNHGIEGLSSWGQVNITGNRFYLSGLSGISLLESQNVAMRGNKINFIQTNGTMKGISLVSSTNCIVHKNTILGNDLNNETIGFYTQDSPFNSLLCNSSSNVNIGEQYSGINSMTNTAYNGYGFSEFGLLLGSETSGSEAIIGPQYHHKNTWPSPDYEIEPAWTLSEDHILNLLSLYTVDGTNPYHYTPENIDELVVLELFAVEENNIASLSCTWMPKDNYFIPSTTLSFATNSNIKNMLLKRQLSQTLEFGLLDSVITTPLNNYYNNMDTTDIGKFSKSKYYFYKAMTDTITLKDNHISSALYYNSEITGTDSFALLEFQTNEILAEYLDEGNVEVLDNNKEFILDVASLCPYRYGPAVYVNRSLAKGMDMTLEFNDLALCGTIEPRSSNAFYSTYYHIFPNPVEKDQEFYISCPKEINYLAVTDLLGHIAFKIQDLKEMNVKMKLHNPGMHIINIRYDDGTSSVSKILVLDK